jgi:hypothetical protein
LNRAIRELFRPVKRRPFRKRRDRVPLCSLRGNVAHCAPCPAERFDLRQWCCAQVKNVTPKLIGLASDLFVKETLAR